jgi:carbon storage regulator
MLVLSRKQGEQIVIGEDIVVTVVDIRNGKVRLGIDAPMATSVHRQEVIEAIRAERLLENQRKNREGLDDQ